MAKTNDHEGRGKVPSRCRNSPQRHTRAGGGRRSLRGSTALGGGLAARRQDELRRGSRATRALRVQGHDVRVVLGGGERGCVGGGREIGQPLWRRRRRDARAGVPHPAREWQELDEAAEAGDRQHCGGGRERRSVPGGVRVLLGGCLVGGDQGQQVGDVRSRPAGSSSSLPSPDGRQGSGDIRSAAASVTAADGDATATTSQPTSRGRSSTCVPPCRLGARRYNTTHLSPWPQETARQSRPTLAARQCRRSCGTARGSVG